MLDDLQKERADRARWLLVRSDRVGRELLIRAVLILLVDVILLSGLAWLLAGSPRLVGEGNLIIRLVFSLGAIMSAFLLAASVAIVIFGLFFFKQKRRSSFLDHEGIPASFSNPAAFEQEFNRTTRTRFANLILEQVQIDAQNRQDQSRYLRWGALFLLIALAPYLVAVIFEVFLLFL